MLRFVALNEKVEDKDPVDRTAASTRADEINTCLDKYNQALRLTIQDESSAANAVDIFQELLDTKLIQGIKKNESASDEDRQLFCLKYGCLKNIARIQFESGQYKDSLVSFCKASSLDNTDITVIKKIGTMALRSNNLELACLAFSQGLKNNPQNWPCLDNIITTLYVVPDYVTCLQYISKALQRDPLYAKGLFLRQDICEKFPVFKKLFTSQQPELDLEVEQKVSRILSQKDDNLRKMWIESIRRDLKQKNQPARYLVFH